MCHRKFPVGRDSLEVKKIIKVKFLWIIATTAGRSFDWVSVFLEKRPRNVFVVLWVWLWSLSDYTMAFYVRQNDDNQFRKYNLDKELNEIKDFLRKKQFFLYWIRHRYQSKTNIEHIEQVTDKSLINSTNSSMNLLYFLHMRVIWFKYSKKCVRSQIKKILTLLVEFMDMSGLTFRYRF